MFPIRNFDGILDTGATNDLLQELALLHTSRLTPELRGPLHDVVSRLDLPALCDIRVDYENVSCWDSIQLRQIHAFFSKREDLDLGYNPEAEALSTFMKSENSCFRINRLFSEVAEGIRKHPPHVESLLSRARRKISLVLGDVPALSGLQFRFGPGATTTIKRRDANYRAKLSLDSLACSENLIPALKLLLEEVPSLYSDIGDEEKATVSVMLHDSEIRFVPKTAKTHRTIAVEPSLNSFFQLGVGGYMEKRLLRVGQDIRDQSRNQRLARVGSIDGTLATLDLSSASDSISWGLVHDLLPQDWFTLLDLGRSARTKLPDGRLLWLEKFSSMGNGYTFPLETLIFWALAASVTDTAKPGGEVSVYGDDIIVATECYPLLSELLEYVGFSLNHNKSFHKGPFRESCGADYYKGINIRPCYIKGKMDLLDIYRLYNFYFRNGDEEALSLIIQQIPKHLRIFGPAGYGDGHLHSDDRSTLEPYKRERGWAGFTFDTLTRKARSTFRAFPGDFVYPLYSIYLSDGSGASPIHKYTKDGSLISTLPGTSGVKRIRIYTLS